MKRSIGAALFGIFYAIVALLCLFYCLDSPKPGPLLFGVLLFGGLAAYMFYSAREHKRRNAAISRVSDPNFTPNVQFKPAIQPKTLQSPVEIAAGAARIIAKTFSGSRFHGLFDDQPMAASWTISDALAVWYALGYFCFLSAAGSIAILDPASATTILDRGLEDLTEDWKMPPKTHEQFKAFLETNIREILAAYEEANDSTKLRRFFQHFISKMLGHDVSFSDSSLVESLLRGGTFNDDLVLPSSIASLFMATSKEVRDFIQDAVASSP